MGRFDFLQTSEYDFLRRNEHLGDNIVLLGYGGSHAYGTNVPTSDVDIRGVAVRREAEILTNQNFEQFTNEATDTVIYALDKFFSLASECNPNIIELLGLRSQDYIYRSDVGNRILENKSMFLSNRCVKTFGGYATSQLYRLKQKTTVAMSEEEFRDHIAKVIAGMKEHLYRETGIDGIEIVNTENGLVANISQMRGVPVENFCAILSEVNNVIREYNKNSKRNSHAIARDKIEKHGLHLLRLHMMLEDLLLKGEIVTYREREHDLLMAIRNKEFTGSDGLLNGDFFKLVTEYEQRVERAKNRSVLPDKPDYKAIQELLRDINFSVIVEEDLELNETR